MTPKGHLTDRNPDRARGFAAGRCGSSDDEGDQDHLGTEMEAVTIPTDLSVGFSTQILNLISEAVVAKDTEGAIIFWNHGAERVYGYRRHEVIGRPASMLTESGDLVEFERTLGRVRKGETLRGTPTVRLDSNRSRVYLSVDTHPLINPADNLIGFVTIAHDRSEQMKLKQEVAEVGQWEKDRIARDLHDSVGQELTGLKHLCGALVGRLKSAGGGEVNALENMKELEAGIARIQRDVRRVIQGLSTSDISAEGFTDAMKRLANSSSRQHGIECGFHSEPRRPVRDDEEATNMYRLTQEAVHNAVRHGWAKNIEILLREQSAGLELTVRDNGVGFDTGKVERGMGLKTMHYRAELIRGEFTIESNPGEGTVVRCLVPREGEESS